jgi:hypothetical protein
MSKKGFDTFALVVNYIDKKWEMCHIIINIFQVHETSTDNKVIQIKDLFSCCNFCDNEITYVKNENINWNTFTIALKNIMSHVQLMLPQPHVASWCGHAMPKCCQYALNAFKKFGGTKEVSIKNIDVSLWSNII